MHVFSPLKIDIFFFYSIFNSSTLSFLPIITILSTLKRRTMHA